MNDTNNPFLEQEIDLREYLDILMRRRWMIISFTLILCTLSLIYSFMMKPVYQGTTRILIEKEAPKVVKMDEVSSVDFSAREYYQTQYKILKSRVVAAKVDAALGGYKPYDKWKGRLTKKDIQELSDDQRVDALLAQVEVKPVPNTQLVEVSVDDIEPEVSARLTNLWADNYVAYTLDAKFEATQYASEWLKEKIKEAQQNLEKSVRELQMYKKEHNITIEDEADGKMGGVDTYQELLKRKSELEIQMAEKLQYFKEKHPEMIGLKSELEMVTMKLEGEKDKKVFSGDKGVQYSVLRQDVETNREIYDALLQRMRETQVTGELKTTNIRVVDKAVVPEKPVKPKKKLNLIIALFVGLFGGGGLAFFIESLDQSVKTPEDLKNRVKMPCLATVAIPSEADEKDCKPEFITHVRPRSVISEAYRGLRTSIMFTAVEHTRKIIMVTSSGPQEGKTTTAINLAIAMAQSGEKTILLDADLRKPRVEEAFGRKIDHGLTDILAGNEELLTDVHKSDIPNLDIITCGSIPPNPSELLGSKKMEEFLAELGKKYDRIIIDTPPVLAVTDAVVLSGKVDGVVIVVRAGETHKNAILRSKELLDTVKTSNLLRAVLNMVEHGKTSGYYYYYRQYYGKKYGKYYGESKGKT
ncbi:MAG: polysaccharide biosynthesis tyrosine autokinase [Candidatus Omnitrophica bacterium]|nr:polysaccharide biosynthesis tyrosine autokinase [Candidatus Omnitrophota bacterium]